VFLCWWYARRDPYPCSLLIELESQLGNKSDLEDHATVSELIDALELDKIRNRAVSVSDPVIRRFSQR